MGDFRNRPLGVLDRIYGFLSGKTQASIVNLESPVTVVHDISRQAELGAAFGMNNGRGVQNLTQTHAGAGTMRQQQNAYAWLTGGLDPTIDPLVTDTQVWILGVDVMVEDETKLSTLSVALGQNNILEPTILETYRPIFYGVGSQYFKISNTSATSDVKMLAQAYNVMPPGWQRNPWPVERGELLLVHSVATAAVTAVIYVDFWVGRKGTNPPGMS